MDGECAENLNNAQDSETNKTINNGTQGFVRNFFLLSFKHLMFSSCKNLGQLKDVEKKTCLYFKAQANTVLFRNTLSNYTAREKKKMRLVVRTLSAQTCVFISRTFTAGDGDSYKNTKSRKEKRRND